jgi:membrane protein DedA with SNARE-associated domain
MIGNLLIFVQTTLLPYGPLGVFLATFTEEVIAPIPSAVVTLSSGFLFLSGSFSLFLIKELLLIVALPTAMGMTIGSLVIYCVAFWGGKKIIDRLGNFLGVTWQDIEKFEVRADESKWDELGLLVVRILPIVPSVVIGLTAGLMRYNLKKFLIITFIGSFIRAIFLGLLGWQIGEAYLKYANFFSKFEYLGFGIIILRYHVW